VAIIAMAGVTMAIPTAPVQDAVVPEDTLVASHDPSGCKTDGEPCVFPYTWGGKEYHHCIEDDWYTAWCGTGSNPWVQYAHCLEGCKTGPEKTDDDEEATGPEPDGETAPAPPAEPEDPDCKKACCTIDLYKKPQTDKPKKPKKPTLGKNRRRYDKKMADYEDKKLPKWEAKVDKWEEDNHMKKIKECSYTGEHPFVAYTDKVKSFKLSGDCEKVTLFDDDLNKKEKRQNNDVTYTSSQDKIDKDLRNDIEGVEIFITNKNEGACKMPDASNVGVPKLTVGKSKGKRLL
jgi:hypothetical protein